MTINSLIPLIHKYRNYGLFLLLILGSFGVIAGLLLLGARTVDNQVTWIEHTESIVRKNQDITPRIERMLASVRGYALSGDRKFVTDYTIAKAEVSDILADMNKLMQVMPEQSAKLEELQSYFLEYSKRLDAQESLPAVPVRKQSPVLSAETIRDNMIRVNKDMLLDAQKTLGDMRMGMAQQRLHNRQRLLIACMVTAILFMIINAWYLAARIGRDRAERNLVESEDAFRLAIEGASDGFFEWNFARDKAFYSKQYLAMLGYEDLPVNGMQAMHELLHPDDKERVLGQIEQYRSGEIGEYLSVFRMRHKTGRWVWINARGRALYDDAGQAYRLVGAHTDITHIKAYEEKLEKAKERAEKANRAKTDFLAHMSHEIRTPLTAISGIAEIFEGTQAGLDARQRQLVRTLSSSTASLKDLINDILDFSKIESGELDLYEKAFDLRDLFDQVVSIFSVKASEKGVRFTFDYSAVRGLQVVGDPVRLRQILINLIGNALKFTPQGSVTVVARSTGEGETAQLRIDVQDSGIGIAPENFALIFERFKQADSSVSRKYGGTGLGLPISLRLARLMGGNILVESKPAEGSLFTLILPLHLAEPARVIVDEPDIDAEAGRPHDIRQKRVLVVDDYEGNIVILSYLLDAMKCPYDISRTGKEGLDKWLATRYDLVLMDVQMPEMDGFTATREIRRTEKERGSPRTPIIGMTAHALVGDREQCIDAGMDAYLPKPIVEAELRAKIYALLSTPQQV